MNRLIILIAMLVASSCYAGEDIVSEIEVFYIPIGVETYIPITSENIEASAAKHRVLEETASSIRDIHRILSYSSNGVFDSEMLRVKIILPDDEVIYIDNFGGVSSSQNGVSKLSDDALERLRITLEQI